MSGCTPVAKYNVGIIQKTDETPAGSGFLSGRNDFFAYILVRAGFLLLDMALILPLVAAALVARFFVRPVHVGIGPIPAINSVYHKKCLELFGYSRETFVHQLWYFTDKFDRNFGTYLPIYFAPYVSFVCALFRSKLFLHRLRR